MQSVNIWLVLVYFTVIDGVNSASLRPYYDQVHGVLLQCGASANACPVNYTCMYDPDVQGMKHCYQVRLDGLRRPGRCWLPSAEKKVTKLSKFCDFQSECAGNERCCHSAGNLYRSCVTPVAIDPIATVTVLMEGKNSQSTESGEIILTSTVGLIQSKGRNILFDLGTTDERIAIENALADLAGLTLADIDLAVTSHGHPDHYGSITALPDTPINFDKMEFSGGKGKFNSLNSGKQYLLFDDPDMELVSTPGHTLQDTSLIVKNTAQGTIIFAGDAVASIDEDYNNPVAAQNITLWQTSRNRIYCIAQFIVPGHGAMFQVTDNMRNKNGGCPPK